MRIATQRRHATSTPQNENSDRGRAGAKHTGHTLESIILAAVVAAAFGPYVVPGVTTAQLVIYPLLILVIPVAIRKVPLYRVALVICGTVLIILVVAVIAYLSPGVNTSPWPYGNALANADNILLPICTAIVVAALASSWEAPARPLRIIATTIMAAMVVNTGIEILQLMGVGTARVQMAFWGEGGTGANSLNAGRLVGIFSEPSLAGAAYAFACISAVYAQRHGPTKIAILGLLVVGGTLTASKVFLLVGLPVLIFALWKTSKRQLTTILVLAFLALPLIIGQLANWRGYDRLTSLLPGSPDWFRTITGNRYGSSSSTSPIISAVFRDHPVAGYGLGGLQTPTDTSYIYMLVLGGLIGMTAIIVQVVAIAGAYWTRRWSLEPADRLYFGAFITITVASTFGTNALNGNRICVLVWALAAVLLIQAPSHRQRIDQP